MRIQIHARSRFVVLLVAFLIFLAACLAIFLSYSWFLHKQARVLVGTARPTFPYSDYNLDELNKLYPQEPNWDKIPDQQTPEQTHALFVAAVKKGDFNEAVNCCFRPGDRVKTLEFLNGLKQKGMIDLMVGDITRDFQKDMKLDSMATYVYNGTSRDNKLSAGFMKFRKTTDGIWYIESL